MGWVWEEGGGMLQTMEEAHWSVGLQSWDLREEGT